MKAPAAAAVKLLRRRPALLGIFPDHAEQRFGAFREVRAFRRPVVHFGIDVGRVVASPGRHEQRIPDPLQIGRLRAGTRGGDHEITSEVIQKSRHVRGHDAGIFTCLQAQIGREKILLLLGETQERTLEKRAVVFRMPRKKECKVLSGGSGEIPQAFLLRGGPPASRHGLPVDEIAADREQKQHAVRGSHAQSPAGQNCDASSGRLRFQAHLITDSGAVFRIPPDNPIAAVEDRTLPVEENAVAFSRGTSADFRLKKCIKGNRPRPVTGNPDHHELGGMADETLTQECRPAGPERGDRQRILQIQRTHIIRHRAVKMKADAECPGGQITLGIAVQDLFRDELVRLRETPIPDHGAGPGEILKHLRTVCVSRKSGPERILIESNRFGFRSAVDHGSDPAVADGKRFLPEGRGLTIMQKCRTFIHETVSGKVVACRRHEKCDENVSYATESGSEFRCFS